MSGRAEQLDLKLDRVPGSPLMDDAELRRRTELGIGEYLHRGRRTWPDMPIARILRALQRQGIPAELAPKGLELIGAHVYRIPEYVAKFNYKVTFPQAVLERCRQVYQQAKQE
ncbi:MAG: hypothetical protein RMM98_07905 [Acidobacteriota bacterium]|nr:hypothetical protein [Blastocatellia bacterium]MDW8239523.1 hypothetical protein [Acidobacteriota bacterium]